MRRIYTHESSVVVNHYRSVLASEGIRSEIRNEFLSGAVGGIPVDQSWPEIWVRERDAEQAEELIRQAHAEPDESASDWDCPECGEAVERQFDRCWNCGTDRPL